ncbi:MAG TPA: efflux RND transporter periplasmic adaptor subunit [Thermoanaerobaculia bacterium]|nr:efflux RND transporter periplasmic adaptor subunit [Thermoanaerobaculia bacterium]
MSRTGWIAAGAAVVVTIVGAAYYERANSSVAKYRAQRIDRGEVVSTVTAAGTLSAVTTVKVGSQVSGIISRLYVDFNSVVKKGQLVAELDPTPFQAGVDQKRADVEKSKVDLRQAGLAFGRQKRLFDLQLISNADYDAAAAARDDAQAAVKQSQAALQQAVTNLQYTKITSPIEGVVVDRQYDIGQTVAASFQAPTLFTIAQDLTKMQVLTNIDEADIGGVKVGQKATFTVDAFPDLNFLGLVSQVRLSTQTVQNVVTYPVVLDVNNADGKLKPGMTANVQIPVDVRRNALRIPNAALRFKPDTADVVSEAPAAGGGAGQGPGASNRTGQGPAASDRGGQGPGASNQTSAGTTPSADGARAGAGEGSPSGGGAGSGAAGGPGSAGGRSGAGGARGGSPPGGRRGAGGHAGIVYVEVPGGKLKPVAVKTSITDGTYTAAFSDALKPGDQVVVGLVTSRAGELTAGRPGSAPRMPRM